jgi:hypothetical protein
MSERRRKTGLATASRQPNSASEVMVTIRPNLKIDIFPELPRSHFFEVSQPSCMES